MNQFAAHQTSDADYINPQDGLRYCGKCRTPKEKYFEKGLDLWGMKKHPVLCRCVAQEQERQDAVLREFSRQNHLQQLRSDAFRDIPAALWKFDDRKMTSQLELARRFTEHWQEFRKDGMGLLLFGNVGTGKSYAAGCIANALIDQRVSVRFVGLSDVVNRMQGLHGDERDAYMKSLLKAELLILDDLGAERSTSFGKEQVFDVINKRTLSHKPLIVTTNIPLHAMQSAVDIEERRIYDRILEVCTPIRFDGENFRKAGAAENLKKAAQLLQG